MFNKKTNHALNKKKSTAIVYYDAYGNVHQITEDDLSSKEEFAIWKEWFDKENHIEEKQNHIFQNHFLYIDSKVLEICSIPSAEDQIISNMNLSETKKLVRMQLQLIRELLSETQFRRLWLYFVCNMDSYQIADMEGVSHQAVIKSINIGRKKVIGLWKNGLLNNPKIGD